MKSIVIYNSKTGFTKKYAEWICEAASCERVEFKKAGKINLLDYDAVIFGGWFMAGKITGLDWFKKKMPALAAANKKLLVYAVGATPPQSPDIPAAMRKNFSDEEWGKVKTFYCPGGLNYDKMNFMSKLVMKMLSKALSSKKDATEAEKEQAKMILSSYDLSDKKYIEPLLAELK